VLLVTQITDSILNGTQCEALPKQRVAV
jgi:hypothetical protein